MSFERITSKLKTTPEQCQQNAQIALLVSEIVTTPEMDAGPQGVRVASILKTIDVLSKAGISPADSVSRIVGRGLKTIVGTGAQSVVYKVSGADEVAKVCRVSIKKPEDTDEVHQRFAEEYQELKNKLGGYVLDQEFVVDDVPYRGSVDARGLVVRQRYVSDRTSVLGVDYQLNPSVRDRALANENLRDQISEFAELSIEMMQSGIFYPDLFRTENLVIETITADSPRLLLIDNGALGYYADRDHRQGAEERYQTCQQALVALSN